MKSSVLLVVFLSIAGVFFAQQWRDSLTSAREAYNSGRYAEAQRKYTAAQQLAPSDIDLTKDVGTSAYRNSDYKTAEDAFISSAQKTEDREARARKFHNAGNAQLKQKNYSAAVESYKEALRNNPKNDETRYNLAEAQRRLKQQQEQNQQQQDQQQQNQQDQQQQQGNQQQDNQSQSNQDNSNQNNQNQNQQNNNSGNSSGGQENRSSESQKLSDKKTERMLDDLMKKEMETKRRMLGNGSGGDKEKVNTGKRW
jgi:Ca-activated chloride channel family protein